MPVALVTGSGKKRVGNHVAHSLARAGYDVAVHYRSSEAEAGETVNELRALGVRAEAFRADLGNEAEVKAAVAGAVQAFGRLDVLVNTAAVWGRKPLEDVTAADVRGQWEANTLGTFLLCREVGLVMVGQPEGGCIVNFGDWADVRPYTDYAAYFPSKSAIPGLTRMFAVELGTRNPKVRVNAILPGPIMLPPEVTPEERAEVIRATLVKREGSPDDVARAVLFFADSPFVTGVCLPVDGGRSVYAGGT